MPIAFCLLPLLLALASPAANGQVTVITAADDLSLSRVRGYDLVELLADRSMLAGQPGTPWLPVRYVHVLLPPGSKAAAVRATVADDIVLDGAYTIHPAQPPVPTCCPGPHPFVEPDPAVYAAASGLRAEVATLADTVILRGYHLAVVRVNPLDYVPATGRLTLRSAITLTVELEDDPAVLAAFNAEAVRYRTAEPTFERLVADDVLNPGDLPLLGYGTAGPRSPVDPDDVAYLLIGSAGMFDEFGPLLEWKTKKGVPAEAVDVSWVYANYAGADQQEKIKACIVDYVENKGTVWVVLAGDNTIVPDRDCYGAVNDGSTTDATIPTDLYYAGLDDMDWDDDGDSVAAEVGDDTIDMAPDVYVGRLPIRTAADAAAIVNKTLRYEKEQPASGFAEKMLLAGVRLWSPSDADPSDAEIKSEYMYADWIDPYWEPVRYRFYDTATDFPGGANYDVTVDNLNDQLVAGYNFLHMATHGNQTLWCTEPSGSEDWYYSADALSVVNPHRYTNVLTMSCMTSAFEDDWGTADPCLSEAFIRNAGGGAVSYIGSSRYGWGDGTPTVHGASFKYDRMFYEFLFTGDPPAAPQQVGAVYTRMKEHWIGSCGEYGAMRWCQFAVNLMGDPELCLYTADPATFVPDFQPGVVPGSQTYVVETGVSGALVCLFKGDGVYTYGPADAAGHYEVVIDPQTPGTLFVTITAPNYDPFEGAPAGVIGLDREVYACSDQISIDLADLDLAGSGAHEVLLTTDGGDSETLTLTDTGLGLGFFAGSLWTSPDAVSIEDGVLQLAHGQTITATYNDADDGSGSPAVAQDTATADCQGPAISNVRVIDVGDECATVTFDTDEPACGVVRYGLSCDALTESAVGRCGRTSHAVNLSGLSPLTTYVLAVEAEDAVGNLSTDDNGGACYQFTTRLTLSASDGAAGAEFGDAVALRNDVAVVGAPGDQAAYVYRRDGAPWVEEARLAPAAAVEGFGDAVAVSGDVALIGAWQAYSGAGAAHVYRFDGANWVAEAILTASDGDASDYFGYSVSVSGDLAVIGAYGDSDVRAAGIGAAYVFRFDGVNWVEEAKLAASDGATYDGFGRAVAVDGDVAVIGAYQDDDGGSNAGSAYVFRFDGLDWTEQAKLTASDAAAYDLFGYAVAADGDVAVIGSFKDDDGGSNAGAAYAYRFDGNAWFEEAKLTASDAALGDEFGHSVALSGDVAVVGAHWRDDEGANSGAAYVYRFDGSDWFEEAILLAFDAMEDDDFGWSVTVSGPVALIGAPGDDGLGADCGSAYAYILDAAVPGDFDGDGDVDLDDFAAFAECLNGPDNPPRCTLGLAADLDNDGDVDLADFAILQANFSGP